MQVHGGRKSEVRLLAAEGDEYWIDCPDTSSAIINVTGNYDGVIEVHGSSLLSDAAKNSVIGSREVFKSGVGSIGDNKIRNSGGDISNEYRISTGGQSIRIKMTSLNSGYAYVRFGASNNSSLSLINGPVHTSEEEAVRARRAYLASTGQQSVTSSQNLFFILSNPVDSNVNLFITERLFGTNQKTGATPIYYQAYSNPTAILANSASVINRFLGENGSSSTFEYEVNSPDNITMGGMEGSGEPIPLGGIIRERKLLVIAPPGTRLGFAVRGTGGLGSAIDIFSTLQWYEETIN